MYKINNLYTLCGSREEVTAAFNPAGEHVISTGNSVSKEWVMELWQSVLDNTWTLIQTFDTGEACIIATGIDWVHIFHLGGGL